MSPTPGFTEQASHFVKSVRMQPSGFALDELTPFEAEFSIASSSRPNLIRLTRAKAAPFDGHPRYSTATR